MSSVSNHILSLCFTFLMSSIAFQIHDQEIVEKQTAKPHPNVQQIQVQK